MAAALPETSPGAKTSFTRSYTAQEPDHLEIYAFLKLLPFYRTPNCAPRKGNKWYTVCIPCAKGGY